MISELYKDIIEQLGKVTVDGEEGSPGLIRHIDLWNRNVEFLEDEQPWPRPAVFVEFGTVDWSPWNSGGTTGFTGMCTITLHVVTDWIGATSADSEGMEKAVAAMDLSDRICAKLQGLCGNTYHNLRLLSSAPNHDHEELVESIEQYRVTLDRQLV